MTKTMHTNTQNNTNVMFFGAQSTLEKNQHIVLKALLHFHYGLWPLGLWLFYLKPIAREKEMNLDFVIGCIFLRSPYFTY